MLYSEKWKRIPNRMQNAYSLIKKSKKDLYLSPAVIKRSKLIPISKETKEFKESKESKESKECKEIVNTTQSSLNNYIRKPTFEENLEQEELEDQRLASKEEIKKLIQSSLQNYPSLYNKIKKLEKEKIACKCSVFSRNQSDLDRVHCFSSIACASDFCINRILEEPGENTKVFTKSPKYYSLSPERRYPKSINKDLVLYEKDIDSITRAVNYFHNHKQSAQEFNCLYTEYIKSPSIFSIPRHKTRSPNFSVPRPTQSKSEL